MNLSKRIAHRDVVQERDVLPRRSDINHWDYRSLNWQSVPQHYFSIVPEAEAEDISRALAVRQYDSGRFENADFVALLVAILPIVIIRQP